MSKSIYIAIITLFFIIVSCDSGSSVAESNGGGDSDGNSGDIIVELPYDVGESLMAEHLDMNFSICYGSDNDSLKFSDLAGKVILINLAASW